MIKVKKTTYGLLPKNNKLTKLATEVKRTIQKIEEEKNKKKNNEWLCKINSINKKEYQKLALEMEILKKS